VYRRTPERAIFRDQQIVRRRSHGIDVGGNHRVCVRPLRAGWKPLRHVDAGVLDIAYYEAGPADGPVVMLMHAFPYDVHVLRGRCASARRARLAA